MKSYHVVGIMSGTSLDGLDMALCEFIYTSSGWKYRIHAADTKPYDRSWKEKLTEAPSMNAPDLLQLHSAYGKYVGSEVKKFIQASTRKVDLVCSHGHTVFHQPEKGFTFQIGDGSAIAAHCGLTTISDFRNMSVALGGEGAPLVPIGDELLFGEYHYCLNLGGFSNISYKFRHKRYAFDVCTVNMVLNHLAQKLGQEYDKDGQFGRKGSVNQKLLSRLESLPFYRQQPPKSLGREWFEKEMLPLIEQPELDLYDTFRTVYEHIAMQIAESVRNKSKKPVLITGGGANNTFLIELLKEKTNHELIIPDPFIVKFKEALIFAFLGVLRYRQQVNCLASVTGSSYDCSGGAIHIVI